MIKILIVSLLSISLLGCTKESEEETEMYSLPKELSDCKVYFVDSSLRPNLTVVRCNNSTTTTQYRSGKTNVEVVVEDVK